MTVNLTGLLILTSGCCKTFITQDDPGLREDTYELCYNSACLSLGQSDVEVAQQKLKKAEGKLAISSSCNILSVLILCIFVPVSVMHTKTIYCLSIDFTVLQCK